MPEQAPDGSIIITPTTTDGVYSGNINVTVDYQ